MPALSIITRDVWPGSDRDFAIHAQRLEACARKPGVAISPKGGMTGHVQLLIAPATADAVSQLMDEP